jgi:hypothetical protein
VKFHPSEEMMGSKGAKRRSDQFLEQSGGLHGFPAVSGANTDKSCDAIRGENDVSLHLPDEAPEM